jgi:excisionase family DNA binding protein
MTELDNNKNRFTVSTLYSRKNIKPEEWVSQAEAARIRGVSRQAIARLVKKGRFRTLEMGGRHLLRRRDVERYRAEPPGRPTK